MLLLTLLRPAVALTTILFVLQRLSIYLRRSITRRKHGCLAPSRLPQSAWRFGTDVQARMARIKTSGHQTRDIQSLFDEYGPTFQATVWGQPWIWTCDVESMKAINTSSFADFCVEPLRKPTNSGWMGDGIFVSDGDRWRHSRALFKPLFVVNGSTDLRSFDADVKALSDVLPTDGRTVDLASLFRKMYFDVSFRYLLGASPGALQPDQTPAIDVDRFHTAFEIATVGMSRRMALGRVFRWADREEKQWREACSYVHGIFDQYIDQAIEQHESSLKRAEPSTDVKDNNTVHPEGTSTPSPSKSTSMLSDLVQITHDRTFLRDQLLNVFLGAKDTASIGIADIFFNLARHPEVWRKLRAEVLSSTEKLSLGPDGQGLTFQNLKSLRYLQKVIKESLRLLAPVDRMHRVCLRDTVLPRGGGPDGSAPLFVPQGALIEGRLSPIHQNVEFWGEDAKDFVPERWDRWAGKSETFEVVDEEEEEVRDDDDPSLPPPSATAGAKSNPNPPPRWEYIPFLGGGRMCPARQMTLTQYAVILVRFTQRYATLENRDPVVEFVEEIKFGKQSANGVLVGLV